MPVALPIMRPKLPDARSLAPYLAEIDNARVYSNFGPLSIRLESRLAAHFGAAEGTITTLANATLGLTLALTAQDAQTGTLCVVPGWTFVASAQAAILAGLIPYFVDVDPQTWALDPDGIDEVIARAPGRVGAVMPVAPFGGSIDVNAWDRFRRRTGLPVAIDAAAGFDTVLPTATPAIVSLHATKVLGVGEGGFVLCGNLDLVRNIRTRSNFGFHGSRQAAIPAINAKLSEYHAAVGLAALDEWIPARAEWLDLAADYRHRLSRSRMAELQAGFGETWVSSVCLLDLRATDADHLEKRMNAEGIETRRWWGHGAHAHSSMSGWPRTPLPTTERLAKSTLAVPMFRDMKTADVDRVIDCIETTI
jgi:dTDP-4-amino-4,6-dideoxygalactose transaminase